ALGTLGTQHRQERDGVVGTLGGLWRAAAGHQVKHLILSAFELFGPNVQLEAPVVAGPALGQLRWLVLARRVERHRRAGDGTAGALDLAGEPAGDVPVLPGAGRLGRVGRA